MSQAALARVDAGTATDTSTWGIRLPISLVDMTSGEPRACGARCEECETRTFPATARCTACASDRLVSFVLPTSGRVYAFSVMPVREAEPDVPRVIGYVDVDPDLRVFVQLDAGDVESLRIDDEVELSVEPLQSGPNLGWVLRARLVPEGEAGAAR